MSKFLSIAIMALIAAPLSGCEQSASRTAGRSIIDARTGSIHEGGHAAFALAFPGTFTLERIVIETDGGRFVSGHTYVVAVSEGAEDAARAEGLRLAGRLAGIAAEELVTGTYTRGSTDEDDTLARAQAQRMTGSDEEARRLLRSSYELATGVLERHDAGYRRLVDALSERGSLEGAEAAAVFRGR